MAEPGTAGGFEPLTLTQSLNRQATIDIKHRPLALTESLHAPMCVGGRTPEVHRHRSIKSTTKTTTCSFSLLPSISIHHNEKYSLLIAVAPLTCSVLAALPVRGYVAVPLRPVRWHGDRVSADMLRVLWCGEQRPCGKQNTESITAITRRHRSSRRAKYVFDFYHTS